MELPDINGLINLMIFGFFMLRRKVKVKQSAATDNQLTTWPFPESGAVLTDR